jgi:signal transduction histidine kinase/HAMP domain-containing protein
MAFKLNALSIRSRVLMLTSAMLLPTLGHLLYDRWESEHTIEAQAMADAGSAARKIAETQSNLFDNAELVLDLIAALPSVRAGNADACQPILHGLIDKNPRYAALGVFTPEGDLICASRPLAGVGNSVSRDWFQAALNARGFAVGEYQVGVLTERPSLGAAKPILRADGSVDSIMYASLNLDWITANIEKTLSSDTAFLLVDRAGTVFSANQPDWLGRHLEDHALFERMTSRPAGYSEEMPGIDGALRQYYFFRFATSSGDPSVYAAVGLPLAALRQEINRKAVIDLALLAAGTLIIVLIGYFLSERTLVQPLQRLAAFSQEVGEGRFGQHTGLAQSTDEIGKLAMNLDRMSDSLHRAEQEKERALRFRTAMLDNITEGIVACNAEGELMVVNRALERIHDEKLSEIPRSDWPGVFDICESDGKTRIPRDRLPLRRALSGERISDLELVVKKRGRSRNVVVNGEEIRDQAGQRLGAVVTIRDVTENRQTEQALRHAQKLEAVGLLSGGIAHDFNNLLSIVIGNIDSLMLRITDPKQKELLTDSLNGALRGAELVKQMRAFARRQHLDPEAVDIAALVQDALTIWKRMLGDDIDVRCDFPEGLWSCVVDANELETSLLNLMTNAWDAMPKGGTITIEARNDHLDAEYASHNAEVDPGDYVRISVSDTGTGIPPDLLPRVIEPFFTTKPPGEGTGLGLSMVYGFVKQSGGHFRIYSEIGHGTTVHLYLPRAAEEQNAAARSRDQGMPATVAPVADPGGRTVLVVDDDEGVRRVTADAIRSAGFKIVEATNAADALTVLRQGRLIDLVVSDVVMPGGANGYDLAAEVLGKFPATRILLVTGFAESAARERAQLGAKVDVITKPYRRQELVDRVHRILSE